MGYRISKNSKKVRGYGRQEADADIVLEEHDTIGFKRKENGQWEFVGDFYGTGMSSDEFMHQLGSEYSYALVEDKMAEEGMTITEESRSGNIIDLVASPMF